MMDCFIQKKITHFFSETLQIPNENLEKNYKNTIKKVLNLKRVALPLPECIICQMMHQICGNIRYRIEIIASFCINSMVV